MAGYVDVPGEYTILPNEIEFHVGEPNRINTVQQFISGQRVVIFQLDGDELAAAWWGIKNWPGNGPAVSPTHPDLVIPIQITPELLSVVTNALSFALVTGSGQIYLDQNTKELSVHVTQEQAHLYRLIALRVLDHINTYLKKGN